MSVRAMLQRTPVALVGSALLLAPSIRAEAPKADDGIPFRLTYAAPEGCPTRDDLLQRIGTYSARAHLAKPTEKAVTLDVTLERAAGGFSGTLSAHQMDGTDFTRKLPAPDCEESVAAIALIAAITIDPDAALNQPPPPEPEPAPPPPPAPPVEPERTAQRTPPAQRPHGWSLGARGGVTSGAAPVVVPDFGVFAAFESAGTGFVAPRFALGAVYGQSSVVDDPTGSARYQRLGGRASGCPVEVLGLETLTLRPCATAELGVLRAEGVDVPNASSQSVLWAAVGASVRADTVIARFLTLGVELGALFPIVRNGFYFDPGDQVVHRVERVAAQGAVEVGFQFR